MGGRQRDGQDGVRAELRLVGRAVERQHRLVESLLVAGLPARDGGRDALVDVAHRHERALLAVPGRVAVAELDCFVGPGARAGRDSRPSRRAIVQADDGLNGRVSTRIEDFAGVDSADTRHRGTPRRGDRVCVQCKRPWRERASDAARCMTLTRRETIGRTPARGGLVRGRRRSPCRRRPLASRHARSPSAGRRAAAAATSRGR